MSRVWPMIASMSSFTPALIPGLAPSSSEGGFFVLSNWILLPGKVPAQAASWSGVIP